jgi:hypothetical protein
LKEAELNLLQAEEVVRLKRVALQSVLDLLDGLQREYDVARKSKEDIEE